MNPGPGLFLRTRLSLGIIASLKQSQFREKRNICCVWRKRVAPYTRHPRHYACSIDSAEAVQVKRRDGEWIDGFRSDEDENVPKQVLELFYNTKVNVDCGGNRIANRRSRIWELLPTAPLSQTGNPFITAWEGGLSQGISITHVSTLPSKSF